MNVKVKLLEHPVTPYVRIQYNNDVYTVRIADLHVISGEYTINRKYLHKLNKVRKAS
jgi:hypothetical protein